jgi:hypothetical protein
MSRAEALPETSMGIEFRKKIAAQYSAREAKAELQHRVPQ